MLIHSGKTGQAGYNLIGPKASFDDFALLFQQDLADIFTGFKTYLGIDFAYNRFVPRPAKAKFVMCRFVAMSANPQTRKTAYTFEIVIGRAGSQTKQVSTPDTMSVEYTFERIVRLLQANGNLGRLAGISELAALEGGLSIPEAHGIQGTNLDIASLLVTYSRDEPQLYQNNK